MNNLEEEIRINLQNKQTQLASMVAITKKNVNQIKKIHTLMDEQEKELLQLVNMVDAFNVSLAEEEQTNLETSIENVQDNMRTIKASLSDIIRRTPKNPKR
tara:strand:+ start:492 stop:794 length:303 start_codon:yes stop_codon:yes gene_type:complete